MKARASWIEHKMTEHLVQTLYRLYSVELVLLNITNLFQTKLEDGKMPNNCLVNQPPFYYVGVGKKSLDTAARTEVPRAGINTFPSFYNHETRFATSNRDLVCGIKWIEKFAINFVKHPKFERFYSLFSSTLYGTTPSKVMENVYPFYPIYLRYIQTCFSSMRSAPV